MPEYPRAPDDGRDILPEMRLSDALLQRPAAIKSPWQILRIAVAVTISWVVGEWISPSTFGIFAPITTLLVIGTSPWSTFSLSIQRVLGTGLGVLLASIWVNGVGVSWWSVFAGIAAALAIAAVLPMSLGAQFQIPTAVLFVFAIGAGSWSQDLWRVLDVAIGGAIGMLAVYLPPPHPRPERFEKALGDYRDALIGVIRQVGQECGSYAEPLPADVLHSFVDSSRRTVAAADRARQALVSLTETARLNPRGRAMHETIDDDAYRWRRLTGLGAQVRTLAGAATRTYDRTDIEPALPPATFESLMTDLAGVALVSLGAPDQPVRVVSRAEVDERADALELTLRRTADEVAAARPGATLESVSLLGRINHIVWQLRRFGAPLDEEDAALDQEDVG